MPSYFKIFSLDFKEFHYAASGEFALLRLRSAGSKLESGDDYA